MTAVNLVGLFKGLLNVFTNDRAKEATDLYTSTYRRDSRLEIIVDSDSLNWNDAVTKGFRQVWLYHNGREAYVPLVVFFSNRANEHSIPIHPFGPSEPNALASGVIQVGRWSLFLGLEARSSGILLMPDANANGSQS